MIGAWITLATTAIPRIHPKDDLVKDRIGNKHNWEGDRSSFCTRVICFMSYVQIIYVLSTWRFHPLESISTLLMQTNLASIKV